MKPCSWYREPRASPRCLAASVRAGMGAVLPSAAVAADVRIKEHPTALSPGQSVNHEDRVRCSPLVLTADKDKDLYMDYIIS